MGYPSLFTPLKLGRCQIKNRLVALPVYTGFAHTDGSVSSWMVEFYSKLAASGVGMVVVANAAVSHDGVVSSFNLRADKDHFIYGLSRLATSIKENGAIACLQLNHAGRFAKTERPLLPSPIISSNLAFNVESLKGFMEFFPFEKRFNLTRYLIKRIKTWGHAMSEADRERVVEDFAESAFRAYEAGFDMVELHGANGYLLCQYLSSFTNQIRSEFGGDLQSRSAFPLAVVKRVRKKVPEDFPVGFRLILREFVPGGIDLPEALAFASLLEDEGIAYLSASVGTYNSILSPAVLTRMSKIAYLENDMAELTSRVNIPTIISGRVTTPLCAEQLVQEGIADLIGLGRPLRTDLEWVAKAKEVDQRKIIECINCNWCLKRVVLENGFSCSLWPRLQRQRTDLEHKLLTRNGRTLWVISDLDDMEMFQRSLPLLTHEKKRVRSLSILFFQSKECEFSFNSARDNFIQWVKDRVAVLDASETDLNFIVHEIENNLEKAVHDEIIRGDYGCVFICSNRGEPWRERLLYKESGRVMLHLNPNSRQKRVVVAVDLSDITLLVMSFLQQSYMEKEDCRITFVHVVTDRSGHAMERWRELKKIARFDENIPLELIFSKTDVAATLIDTIQSRGYGTVVMGKRGLAGIKRWLLGSVSAAVLRNLTDHSMFLID